jgi:phospholipid/cholesterol/gamma-HCH transport system ATP-binding protein
MIKLKNITKKFNNKIVINGVNLTIPEGKTTCIIGRSGEGKSVLLKQITGLIKPTSGTILFDNIDITSLAENEMFHIFNKCGYVFQFAALLDSLTIFENIALSLLENNISKDIATDIVVEKLALVDLSPDILNKYPDEISGGMKKRVGLARTLVKNPTVILYDEPTTGLDPINSRVVHELITSLQDTKVTSVIVSHDIEIFNFADYVALLHDGKIQYFGNTKDIWNCENPYLYQFIRGLTNGPITPDAKSLSSLNIV